MLSSSQTRANLSAVLVGLGTVVVLGFGWVVVLTPTSESGLRPFLLILVAVPTTVAVALGAATLARIRFTPGEEVRGESLDVTQDERTVAAVSIVSSALGFAVVATVTATLLDVQGFIALTVGLGLGTGVGLVLALGSFNMLAETNGSIFAAETLGNVSIVLTAIAVGVVGTFSVGLIATAVLIQQHGAVPQLPLLSIPVGVLAGLLLTIATGLALRRRVHRDSAGESST